MSKIGKKPVIVPEGVSLKLEGGKLVGTGKLGSVTIKIPAEVEIDIKEGLVIVIRKGEDQQSGMTHGTMRQLIANLVKGVSEGWKKELEVKGTGFRVEMQGEELVLTVGFSHPVKVTPPAGIKFEAKENKITVIGADKSLIGETAEKIRKIRPPDSYKGKGIKYLDEKLILKPGKATKIGAGSSGGAPAGGKNG